MENKIERLRASIKANPNLSEEFKCNLGTLTDTMVTVFPDYDYTNYERILYNLKVKNNESINLYATYDNENNIVEFNTSKIFEDRIDMQYLFLENIVRMGSGIQNLNPTLDGYITGLTEVICSTMNNDESMKKLNVLEGLAISIFSKIVNPEVLLESYMTGDMSSVVVALESFGISQNEFNRLLSSFNNMSNNELKENSSFTEAETIMIDMFNKKVDTKLKTGTITYEDINSEYDDFSAMLIFGKSELVAMYPHHDFSNIIGFENVKTALESAIIDSEIIEDVEMVK